MKRSVAGIVQKEGKLLIAKRLPGGSMGQRWEFPGGKVEANETDEEALIREYQEELSVSVSCGRKLASAVFYHKGDPVELNAWELFLEHENFVLAEHDQWRWAAIEEIPSLNFADSDLLLLDKLKTVLPGTKAASGETST